MWVSRRAVLCLGFHVLKVCFWHNVAPTGYTEACLWPREPKERQEPAGGRNMLLRSLLREVLEK